MKAGALVILAIAAPAAAQQSNLIFMTTNTAGGHAARVPAYRFEQTPYSFEYCHDTDPSTGQPFLLNVDDGSAEYVLPFAFPFFDTTYQSVFPESDGYLTFDFGESTYYDTYGVMMRQHGIANWARDLVSNIYACVHPDHVTFRTVGVDFYEADYVDVELRLFANGRIEVAFNNDVTDAAKLVNDPDFQWLGWGLPAWSGAYPNFTEARVQLSQVSQFNAPSELRECGDPPMVGISSGGGQIATGFEQSPYGDYAPNGASACVDQDVLNETQSGSLSGWPYDQSGNQVPHVLGSRHVVPYAADFLQSLGSPTPDITTDSLGNWWWYGPSATEPAYAANPMIVDPLYYAELQQYSRYEPGPTTSGRLTNLKLAETVHTAYAYVPTGLVLANIHRGASKTPGRHLRSGPKRR